MYKTNGCWQARIIYIGDPSVIIIDKVCPPQQQQEPTVGKTTVISIPIPDSLKYFFTLTFSNLQFILVRVFKFVIERI